MDARNQVHTDNSAVIQGFADRAKCLAGGKVIALQMMHIHGETLDFALIEDIGGAAQNKVDHSEASILCLNVATGETANETVADPS